MHFLSPLCVSAFLNTFCVIPFHPHNERRGRSLLSFYRWGDWGLDISNYLEPRFPNRSLFPESRFLTNMFYHLPGSGCPGVLWTHSCHHHTLLADSFHLNLYLELIHDWPPIFHFSGGANDHGIVWYIPRILLKFYQFEALVWITNFCISDLLKMLDTHTIQREMKTQGVGTQWQTLKKKRKLFGFFF